MLPKSEFSIQAKRIYEFPSPDDGYRIFVDRLWPRGIQKDDAKINLWLKEIAPSNSLRKWFSHDPEKWEEFKQRHCKELDQQENLIDELIQHTITGKVTLLFSAKKESQNNTVALWEYFLGRS